jgi:hypothetical protein
MYIPSAAVAPLVLADALCLSILAGERAVYSSNASTNRPTKRPYGALTPGLAPAILRCFRAISRNRPRRARISRRGRRLFRRDSCSTYSAATSCPDRVHRSRSAISWFSGSCPRSCLPSRRWQLSSLLPLKSALIDGKRGRFILVETSGKKPPFVRGFRGQFCTPFFLFTCATRGRSVPT